jgi:hypothetical protein
MPVSVGYAHKPIKPRFFSAQMRKMWYTLNLNTDAVRRPSMNSIPKLRKQAAEAVDILSPPSNRNRANLVIGCSTSEIIGKRIGSASSEDAAKP